MNYGSAPLDVMCNFKHILFEHCIIAHHVTSASFLLALLAQFFSPHLQPNGGKSIMLVSLEAVITHLCTCICFCSKILNI